MVDLENKGAENSFPSGEQSATDEGKDTPGKISQSKSTDTKEYQKKKKDALEGKERGNDRGESDSDDEGHHAADKAEGEDTATHSRQGGLQSGQTTVQFSSGGGVGGNASASLNSLLGLFASSANLVRIEGGGVLNVSNQTTSLIVRGAFQASGAQLAGFLNEGGNLKGNVVGSTEQASESASSKFNLDTGGISTTRSSSSGSQDTFSQLINSVSTQASEGGSDQGSGNSITLTYALQGSTYYIPAFNTGSFFFSPQTQFVFGNSSSPYTGVIQTYLTDVGIPSTGSFSYQLAGALSGSGVLSSFPSGVTFTPGSSAPLIDTAAAPSNLSPPPSGITITSTGNVYVNAPQPMSVSFTIEQPGEPALTVRVDAGPGPVITSSNATVNGSAALEGTTNNGQYQSVVLSDSTGYTLVGTGANLTVGNSTNNNDEITTTNANFGVPSSGVYAFPPNTIYQHVAETAAAAAAGPAAYGNFDNASGSGNIYLPNAPSFDTLTMGGNVLDVYGTKYGVANTLNVILPSSPAATATNTLTMGDNTLAGFGTSYGDLQTLTVTAQSGNTSTNLGSTDFVFRGNNLAVDKSISSVLYPHLQTLDLEQVPASSSTTPPTPPANVQITFQDSLIQGNAGGDTYYGDIQNLSNLSSSTSYGGFTNGVTVTDANKQVTTTDGNGNSITWGNDIYINSGTSASGTVSKDTYNFTLLDDTSSQPGKAVMQGNALLVNFNLTNDTLNFQVSPTLFRSLDGADGQGHNKQITPGDLNASVKFGALTSANLDATQNQYLTQNGISLSSGSGATSTPNSTNISFDNGLGGSLNLVGDAGLTSFADIPNLTTNISLVYSPIATLSAGSIIATTPRMAEPFIYNNSAGTGANGSSSGGFYFNELDNFFSNSLLTTYTISGSGVTISPTTLTSAPAGAVAIDQYGTIAVDSGVTTPVLTQLAITATDQDGATASTTQFFGFLAAPIETTSNSSTTATTAYGTGTTNIINGSGNLTMYGEPASSATLGDNGATFGSNLIVDTTGASASTTAYGDFQTASLTVQGSSGSPSSAQADSETYTFGTNAFYVSGSVYGIAQTFDILAQGGLNDVVQGGGQFNASAQIKNTVFDFGTPIASQSGSGSLQAWEGVPLTIYGNTTIYGELQTLSISDIAGSGATFQSALLGIGGSQSASLDISSDVEKNHFNFAPVQITVQGGTTSQTTSIYPNLASLLITVERTSSATATQGDTLTTSATFQNNTFTFGNDTLTGGVGATNFYADIDLAANTSPYAYNGFISGVTTAISNGALTTTSSDNLGNAITWGNNTFIGGTGANAYNFTLLYNPTGTYASGVDSYGVFTGFDTITNFRLGTSDVLKFTIAPNLYQEVLTATGTTSFTAADLDTLATFSNSNGNTVISFNFPSGEGNGSLTLDNVTVSSFSQLNISISSANVSATINTGAAFDPVFAKGTSSQSLSAFVNLPPNATAAYAATGVTYDSTNVTSGIGVNSNGTINVSTNLSAPVDATLTGVTAAITEGGTTTTLNLPNVHIFASNAASVYNDATAPYDANNNVSGSTVAQAYEVTAGTVYGGGGDIALSNITPLIYGSKLIDDTSTTTHTIYGDVQNITYDGSALNPSATFIFEPNLINVNIGATGTDQIFGNAQNLTLSIPGASTNSFSVNTFNFGFNGSNTLYGSGTLYGDIQTVTLTDLSQNQNIGSNTFNFGGNTLTGGAYLSYENTITSSSTPTTLYGDVGSLSLTGAGATISSNAFTFEQNTLTGSQGGSALYAGVDQLIIENTQAGGQISGNHLTFHDSALTGVGDGLTKFYGDINDLSQTNFYDYGVTATTSNGQVQITDSAGTGLLTPYDSSVSGNMITFGNDKMIGSLTGTSVFNVDLFAATNGSIVGEGNTTIVNFSASSGNILDLHLSQALYDDILTANGIPLGGAATPITGAMLDAYYTLNTHDNITQTGGNTLINFSDGTGNNSNFGSITLEGVTTVNSFASLGTNLEITADGITTMDPSPSPSNVYHVDVSGANISSFTENTHIVDVSSLGHVVDFGGTLDLGMSNALFKSLGLSDTNTAAQNLQILENDAHTATGGIAVTTSTTGTGADAATNTTLTFETTTHGVVNTYGSVTLHDTHFNPSDPLSAHLQVIHH